MSAAELVASLVELRDRLATVSLDLVTPGADAGRRLRGELADQLDDYLLPRLSRLDAPLLAVVGGSTGAGKSTLVNSLVGENVSRAGWLRPTTRGPVLVCHPDDLDWFRDDRILPGLARSTGPDPVAAPVRSADARPTALRLVAHRRVPRGLALLDAPDIDSVVAGNRELARQLLAAADLWLFVTSAARYADAVPWQLLAAAQRRGTALAVVLNRVPPEGLAQVRADLAGMLQRGGLSRAVLFAVPESPLAGEDDRLPEVAVQPLRAWVDRLARDAASRGEVVRATLDGALRTLRESVAELAREIDLQSAAAAALRDEAERAHLDAALAVDDAVRSGSVLRGEVLARWQEFVGTGEFTRSLERRIGRVRDRIAAALTGRPAPGPGDGPVERALEHSVETVIRSAADGAAERTVDAWRATPVGRALLDTLARGNARLGPQASPGFGEALVSELRQWQEGILRLVAEEGGQRRTAARVASLGTNGVGLVLMLAVFAQTGGLTGAEVLVAGGTSVAGQRVLEAIFGDGAVRALAARARADLLARVERLLAAEQARFTAPVDAAAPAGDTALALRAWAQRFERARRAGPGDAVPAGRKALR